MKARTATWSQVLHGWDEDLAELSAEAKLLFVWSFTNGPSGSLTGITVASSRRLRRLLWPGVEKTEDDLAHVLAALGAKPFVVYDWDHELLWCLQRAKHAVTSPNHVKGAQRQLARLPKGSELIGAFYDKYPNLKPPQ